MSVDDSESELLREIDAIEGFFGHIPKGSDRLHGLIGFNRYQIMPLTTSLQHALHLLLNALFEHVIFLRSHLSASPASELPLVLTGGAGHHDVGLVLTGAAKTAERDDDEHHCPKMDQGDREYLRRHNLTSIQR